MKYKLLTAFCALALLFACQDQSSETQTPEMDTTTVNIDTPVLDDDEHIPDTLDVFSGGRFRNVQVNRIGDSTFEIKGEAQVFEAAFGWVIEDGGHEVKQGHGTTDAGAPAWGKFTFEVTAAKPTPESLPQLTLFEPSAKDGSRQHELPVLLYR